MATWTVNASTPEALREAFVMWVEDLGKREAGRAGLQTRAKDRQRLEAISVSCQEIAEFWKAVKIEPEDAP